MDLSILIVGYNNTALIEDCLSYFYTEVSEFEFEVIIVENGEDIITEPDFIDKLQYVKWIKSPYNAGFAKANNLAYKHAKGRDILIMNPDIKMNYQELKEFYNRHKHYKKTISTCKLIYPDGSAQVNYETCKNRLLEEVNKNVLFEKLKLKIKPKFEDKICELTGALFMFNKDILGGRDYIFKPFYFMYSEELDFFHNIMKSDINIKVFNDLPVIHKSEGTITNKKWMKLQKHVSYLQFIRNNYSIFYYFSFIFINCINTMTSIMFLLFLKLENKQMQMDKIKIVFKTFKYYIILIFYPTKFIALKKN